MRLQADPPEVGEVPNQSSHYLTLRVRKQSAEISEPNTDDVTGSRRQLRYKQFTDSHSSPNIITGYVLRSVRLAGNVARMGEGIKFIETFGVRAYMKEITC